MKSSERVTDERKAETEKLLIIQNDPAGSKTDPFDFLLLPRNLRNPVQNSIDDVLCLI